ncbi:MAG: hypothetical protein IPH31_09725 [Lewinellaceae bacterium]|nr:hypothetical protein [Lewinellaceae bacterium]
MKHFYGFLSNLFASIKLQSGNKTHPKANGFSTNQKNLAGISRVQLTLVVITGLSLFSLLFWTMISPDQFRQVRLAIGEEIKLTLSAEKHLEYTFNAPHQQWIDEAGVSISAKKDLGRTAVTVSHRAVTIDKRSSIRKVVGIHPEHDEDLDAEMLFTYTDAELNGLDETKLVLYSSNDNGVTWQSHINSVTDPQTNTIHLGGIRHFSLWTAALQMVQGPGCVTTGIGAWWRSDNGCSTTAWNDFSGNGYHTTAVNSPVFATTGANFNPMVKLTSDYYKYTVGIFKNSPGIVNSKVFAVTIPIQGQNNHPWGEYTTNGHNYFLLAPHYNNYTYHDAPYGHRVYNIFTSNGGQYGVPNIIAGERTQNNMSIRTNGKVQNFPGSYGGTFTSHTNLNFLGAHNGSPTTGGAGLAEVIVYRDASSMTATQVQKMKAYLALKYGITLDQTTPKDYLAGDGSKMWDATANGAFKYNIAGLGRDDCQSLHQKQSKSINPNQFITFATGSSIKADNASNSTAITADNSYLSWADNNTSQTTTVAVAGTNVSDRMTRVWKVDKTNWTDQNITVKAAGYANRYLIIHNTSATFATAPSQEILLDANGQATFNSSLLPDGAFFSIGNIVKGPACLSAGIGGWWRADQECYSTSWEITVVQAIMQSTQELPLCRQLVRTTIHL